MNFTLGYDWLVKLYSDLVIDSSISTCSILKMEQWYHDLNQIKNYLIAVDPILKQVFDTVDTKGFQLHTMIKSPYPALIAAIIGQKISYSSAKKLRSQFYSRFGNEFKPCDIVGKDLSFLGSVPARIIQDVSVYLLTHPLETEEDIRSLNIISGIGSWTIETTLLTCFKNWDIFPLGDKFLQNRIKRLYGTTSDIKNISNRWSPYRTIVTWYLWRYF